MNMVLTCDRLTSFGKATCVCPFLFFSCILTLQVSKPYHINEDITITIWSEFNLYYICQRVLYYLYMTYVYTCTEVQNCLYIQNCNNRKTWTIKQLLQNLLCNHTFFSRVITIFLLIKQ